MSDDGVKKLETELTLARRWGARSVNDLYRRMLEDLTEATRRATQAETRVKRLRERLTAAQRRATRAEARVKRLRKRLTAAQRRARRSEDELAAVRRSSTWRVGSLLVAIPSRVKRAIQN